jgi:hypothetical protein
MDVAIVVAIIALAGTIANTGLTLFGQRWLGDRQQRHEAEAILARYRDPLASAAYDLQSRLYNILQMNFLGVYYKDNRNGKRDLAAESTLYVVGQYFAWSEILRRELQFLDFRNRTQTRDVARLQEQIATLFSSDEAGLGPEFMLWRSQQRAIGERMISVEDSAPSCIGVATFSEQLRTESFQQWFGPLEQDLATLAQTRSTRLRLLQHELVHLVQRLDSDIGASRFESEKLQEA